MEKLGWRDRRISPDSGSLFQTILSDAALLYRVPNQPSLDQNTVDVQVEQAKYAENSIRFQAAFTRLNGAFKGLMMALKGG